MFLIVLLEVIDLTPLVPGCSALALHVFRPHNFLWPSHSVLVVIESLAVAEVVGAAVRVPRPVAEGVAVA